MSEHSNLWAALLAFKAEVPALPKDKINPHFKSRYTPLDTIAEKIDPLLTKHGLVWTALPSHENGHPTLNYQLAHVATGEVLSGSMLLLLDKENSQGLGSALTYSRRYAKTSVLDLVADEDDDGNSAENSGKGTSTVTVEQAQGIKAAMGGLNNQQITLVFSSLGLDATKPLNTVPRDKAVSLAAALKAVERKS